MSEWTHATTQDRAHTFSIFAGVVEKPDLDDRGYRLIELKNGLRTILIHDATAEKAAACATVHVGSMRDPPDAQGLAHFCEHMLSKGTEAFPEENNFMSYIYSHGGLRNASTTASHTNYWFSIGASHLPGALARLAAFFHCPLFTESLTQREINAVVSEYRKNIQNDGRRTFQIGKTLSAEGHPYGMFSTGCVESITEAARRAMDETRSGGDDSENILWKETRRTLVEWWEREYCAERITLAVLGKETLDELMNIVVPLFSPIQRRGLDPRPVFPQSVWSSSEMGSIVFIKTVSDYYSLEVTWNIPDQRAVYDAQPASVVAHFLGHEGPGSIYAYLKRRGWLVGINASPTSRNPSVQQLKVSATLTKEGYVHYQDVILTIYAYLSLLRASFPLPAYHFSELHAISQLHFRFQEKVQPMAYVRQLARDVSEPWAPAHVLSGASLMRMWNEAEVQKVLEACAPDKGRVIVEAREHEPEVVGEGAIWEKERWLGGEYSVQRLDEGILAKARGLNENPELHLPRPNPFIPTDLNVEKNDVLEPAKAPTCIRRTPLSALWHKKDDQFWVPKAIVKVDIRSPLAYGTPRQAILTRLLLDLVEDALSEEIHDASLAGLSYALVNHRKGVLVSVSGYNDKLSVLLQIVLDKLRSIKISADRFKVIAEEVNKEYENFYLGQPSNLSQLFASWTFMETIWTPEDKRSELPFIDPVDVQRHKHELLDKVHIETLVTGNMEKETAINIIESVEECIGARPLLLNEHPRERGLVIPPGSDVIMHKTHANTQETNSSLSYYCQFGPASDDMARPALELIAQIMKEPAYTQLRTVKQLGYVVHASPAITATNLFLTIKIQSMYPPWTLEAQVEEFLEWLRRELAHANSKPESGAADMSQVESRPTPKFDFEAKKEGLIVRKLERAKNISDETAKFWTRIDEGNYDFFRNQRDAETIRSLTLDNVLAIYHKYVKPPPPPHASSNSRRKLSLYLTSQLCQQAVPEARPIDERSNGHSVVNMDVDPLNFAIFKTGLACYPAVIPITNGHITSTT